MVLKLRQIIAKNGRVGEQQKCGQITAYFLNQNNIGNIAIFDRTLF
ncbi:hypothetical protein [Rodentibacter caecimuris]